MKREIDLYGDGIGMVEYVQHMGSDVIVVNAARVSFGAEVSEMSEKDEKLIQYLIDHRHTSPLEHNVITFRFTVPLYIRSQHHRHRTWSYNEISRRYTSVDMQFYTPDNFRPQSKSNRQASINEPINPDIALWETTQFGKDDIYKRVNTYKADQLMKIHTQNSLDLYNQLLENGVCREQARGVLPQNLYTMYYGTVNLSNLLKFVSLRTHDGAQWEIQQVAKACLEIAKEVWPVSIKAFMENHEQ